MPREKAATSNDQVQNTKSPPVPSSKRPTEEFITDKAAAISELLKLRAAYAAGARKIAIISSTRDEYSHFQGELESIYNKFIAVRDSLDVPLFSIPPNQAALDKIVARVTSKRKKAAAPTENNTLDNTIPPIILSNAYEEVDEIEFDAEQPAAAVVPRVKIPPFLIQPNPDWTDLMVFAHGLAPTLQSKLSGRFLRITVQSEEEYRKLATYFRHEQIAFKSFMLKSEKPLKLILRGLPTSTELEAVKKEIKSEGFKIHKISRLTKSQSKAQMPLIYIQLINDLNADSIYNYVDMFGSRVAFEPYDGSYNRRPNQCWRCQGFFHSSEVCHLPMKCLKCARPHQAKDCTLHFEDPLKCANCGGEHAANWRQCPRFSKSKKAPNHQNKGGNIKNNNPKPSNKNINQGNQNTAPEVMPSPQNLKHNNQLQSPQSYRTTDPKLPYSKVVSGQIPANQPRKNINNNDQNFSALFCSVLAISNDAGVDLNLLAKAFRQSLPALKNLNDANEKSCICFWNANGLRPKICEVRDFVSEQNPDLLLVQEMKLQPGLDPLIANYHLHKDDRNNFPRTRTDAGTVIYCKNNYDHNRVPLPTLQYMDAAAIEIKLNNFPPILIVSAYARNTPENNRKFPDKDFLKILNSGQNIIIAGDLNAAHRTWSNARSNAFGYALRKIVNNKSNVRIVVPHTPTHINASSRPGARDSIIDLAVLKNIPFNHDIRVIDDLESDHLPVILTLCTGSALIKIPDQLSTNWENFKFLLNNKPLPIPPSSSNGDLEIAIRKLGENISEALIEASKPKFKQPSLKLPSEIKVKIRNRNLIRKFWQRTRDPAVKSEFRTLSREGALGSVANHLLEKAEVIADSLQRQFEPNTEAENDLFTARIQRKIKRFLDAPTYLDLEKTTPGEVQEYIKKLKINKSPGLDLITNRILKNLPLKFVLFILMLFNLLMENCHFPKNWKTAVVVPILKPNSDGTRPQNYCPISLLSSLSKVYEFVLLNRLSQHCIARNIIIPEQHGFVTQCSIVTQLLRVTELIHHGFQNNQAMGMLFVDIAKAFDKIWHDGFLFKMMRLGFSDQLIKIIHSYLNSREFRVRVENSLSTPRPILSGVPQGSLLGPKLFNLYINDIPKADEVHLAMYADDTAIFTKNVYNYNMIERLHTKLCHSTRNPA
ncbi:probable RNA-directed DNA polymerase from transposon X-element [Trichonephila clavipes]|nr:probable RNA-directed DNA polymerase from transposon X-element [Trichonephila clavipes]